MDKPGEYFNRKFDNRKAKQMRNCVKTDQINANAVKLNKHKFEFRSTERSSERENPNIKKKKKNVDFNIFEDPKDEYQIFELPILHFFTIKLSSPEISLSLIRRSQSSSLQRVFSDSGPPTQDQAH